MILEIHLPLRDDVFGDQKVRFETIKRHLRPQKIRSRRSTIDGTFVSALAPYDEYSRELVIEGLKALDQDPDKDLLCTYCGQEAATWDHIFNRVVQRQFSGYGHTVRNLVPCCRSCNERKGGSHWRDYLATLSLPDFEVRAERIERFLDHHTAKKTEIGDFERVAGEEYARFMAIRDQVHELIDEADNLASVIREKMAQDTEE
ncbi:MAG: hypothetical protein HN461_07510 [Rhodospirillaceae bacterium]|jgi:5-methylcytosine-specific restriction endonuclease McrA|nr:hypothetical protein [Rhodospirillaceae bacterium]